VERLWAGLDASTVSHVAPSVEDGIGIEDLPIPAGDVDPYPIACPDNWREIENADYVAFGTKTLEGEYAVKRVVAVYPRKSPGV